MSDRMAPAELKRLEARIRAILARGVAVGSDVMRFAESTLPLARPGGLAHALAEASTEESAPVLALLFFPEESLQREIEETLAGRALTAADEQRLALSLAAGPPRVSFHFPEGGGRLELEMSSEQARGFIAHLRLTRSVPKALDDAAAAALAPAERSRFRVLWRNARCADSGETVWFLCQLLRGADLRERNGWMCLGFLLEFLAEAAVPADIYQRLVERKAFLAAAVNRSRTQRAQLAHSNLETLISRGMRLVAIDEEEALRHIACIDQACLTVYGRLEAIDFGAVTLYDTDT